LGKICANLTNWAKFVQNQDKIGIISENQQTGKITNFITLTKLFLILDHGTAQHTVLIKYLEDILVYEDCKLLSLRNLVEICNIIKFSIDCSNGYNF